MTISATMYYIVSNDFKNRREKKMHFEVNSRNIIARYFTYGRYIPRMRDTYMIMQWVDFTCRILGNDKPSIFF